jgi:hypothetical protein
MSLCKGLAEIGVQYQTGIQVLEYNMAATDIAEDFK